MSLRDQVTAFRKRGSDRRREIHGTPFLAPGISSGLCGTLSAITTRRDQEAGGWGVDISAVLGVTRSAYPSFTPRLGLILTLTETRKRYEISEIKDNPRSPEWVLGLINPQEAQDA